MRRVRIGRDTLEGDIVVAVQRHPSLPTRRMQLAIGGPDPFPEPQMNLAQTQTLAGRVEVFPIVVSVLSGGHPALHPVNDDGVANNLPPTIAQEGASSRPELSEAQVTDGHPN